MKTNYLLAAGAVVVLAVIVLFTKGGSPAKAPDTGGKAETPSSARINSDGSVSLGVKTYYAVKSTDPTGDTGNKVCAKVGKKCMGYTDLTLSACLAFHPDAASASDLDGARAGFYCNGTPQGGICAKEMNTCHICPKCNLNMECETVVGDLYRETFVECK